MKAEDDLVQGVTPEVLQRYLEVRSNVDDRANRIYLVSKILSHLEDCDEEAEGMGIWALPILAEMIQSDIARIVAGLNYFIPTLEAQAVLEQSEG
jgi:hypothetical protein